MGCCGHSRGKYSPSLQQLKGEGLICSSQPFWSLTVHFIHQISFEAGLEGLAFPPSWAWDALGGLQLITLISSCRWWWLVMDKPWGLCLGPGQAAQTLLVSNLGNETPWGCLGMRETEKHLCIPVLHRAGMSLGRSLAWEERMDPEQDYLQS